MCEKESKMSAKTYSVPSNTQHKIYTLIRMSAYTHTSASLYRDSEQNISC